MRSRRAFGDKQGMQPTETLQREETCDVCQRLFTPRLRFQTREENGRFLHLCSLACQRALQTKEACCDVCGASFVVEYAYQLIAHAQGSAQVCSTECRAAWAPPSADRIQRIAVFNHKGGTAKTTTSVNLAAALAASGERVLLIDADGQGNVGASLGIRGERSLYDVLVHGTPLKESVVALNDQLDVLTSNASLAAAELYLAQLPSRARVMRERVGAALQDYDRVIVDCAPALSLMNQNALMLCQGVLVPVACDYLSLIGVRQVMNTLQEVKRTLMHEVELLGVLPTFFDIRNKISNDALRTMLKTFGERCLPPIRINTKLREAPRARQTIFECAPHSHGAEDYARLAERVLAQTCPVKEVAA